MGLHRFYVEELATTRMVIDDTEAHHAIKVLRLQVGTSIELFDGKGNVAIGTVESMTKRELVVTRQTPRFEPKDNFDRIQFAVSLPKGDRQRNTVEKLVELGVDRLTPLHTERSVAEIDHSNRERLIRYALESCKQCRRNRTMRVEETKNISQLRQFLKSEDATAVDSWVLHPAEQMMTDHSGASLSLRYHANPAKKLLFIVGPEGGFTNSEVSLLLESGAGQLSLGDRILRVETAVSVAATLASIWIRP